MFTSLPFTLPAWMPDWVFLLLLLPALLWVLAFLLMPFSVFGVKGRLEALEAQVDAMHEEMRMAAMRAAGVLSPAAKTYEPEDESPMFGRMKKAQRGFSAEPEPPPPPPRPASRPMAEPVIMPPPMRPRPAAAAPQDLPPRPPRRSEPRLD